MCTTWSLLRCCYLYRKDSSISAKTKIIFRSLISAFQHRPKVIFRYRQHLSQYRAKSYHFSFSTDQKSPRQHHFQHRLKKIAGQVGQVASYQQRATSQKSEQSKSQQIAAASAQTNKSLYVWQIIVFQHRPKSYIRPTCFGPGQGTLKFVKKASKSYVNVTFRRISKIGLSPTNRLIFERKAHKIPQKFRFLSMMKTRRYNG